MPLIEEPEVVDFPSEHFVHVKKEGPFSDTARACWSELHAAIPQNEAMKAATKYFSLYLIKPEMVYLAGVAVESEPETLPDGVEYIHFEGGKYLQFKLVGPYDQLPEAVGRVFQIINSRTTDKFREAYFAEHYANNPATTPPEELITYILIPIYK